MKKFKIAVVGRSNSGKSTFVSVLIADEKLGESLHLNNEKGKTKLNTNYCLHKYLENTEFKIVQNESIVFNYFDPEEENFPDNHEVIEKLFNKITNSLKSVIPEIKDISRKDTLEELSEEVNKLVTSYIEEISHLRLEALFQLSEEKPVLRNLIELVIVNTRASEQARKIMIEQECDVIEIIDTKGFGDRSELIEYDFPQVDAVIFMVAEKYIDSDYRAMKEVISDQVKKVPVIIGGRGQKLRIPEVNEILQEEDIFTCLEEYSDTFTHEENAASLLKKHLYDSNILQNKIDAEKSIMELYLKNDDIFRTIPWIFKENEKSGKILVTSEMVRNSKYIYNKVVIDIINKVMTAKIKEDNAVNKLINKLSGGKEKENISASMKGICKSYIMQASISMGISEELQREYFGRAVQSMEKFTGTIHRYIHGPRGGTTGYYAYNYDRLAIASYVCLEKGFESMIHKGVEGLDSAELELIIRKVRRDICRYGKLAGLSESYMAYIDYSRLCSAYDTERFGRGEIKPWGNNFENYSYSYGEVRDEINNSSNIRNKTQEFKHAASIYYGVIGRAVRDAIDEVLGAMPREVNEFVRI